MIPEQLLYSFTGAGNGWGRGQGHWREIGGIECQSEQRLSDKCHFRGGGRGRRQRGSGGGDGLIPFR